MKRLLTGNNFAYYTKNGVVQGNVLIENGKIAALNVDAKDFDNEDCQIVNLHNATLFPGFVDVHVHLREPGFSYKETILSGTKAAARGGVTTVFSMPNLNPVPDSVEHLGEQLKMIEEQAQVKVIPYASITIGQKGEGELVDFESLAHNAGGFSDDGRGIQEEELMLEAMKKAKAVGKPIVAHCEVEAMLHGGYIHAGEYAREMGHRGISSESEWSQVERDIRLVEQTGCQYHVCHISTKESVELIRQAKAKGLPVSCETAPHYLLMNDSMLQEEGRFKMNPPIRSEADREALVRGVIDGTIDVIATDHAPHSAEEKSKGLEKSAFGVVGIEFAFASLYKGLVEPSIITLERLVEMFSLNARDLFKLGGGEIKVGEVADLVAIDLREEYKIDPAEFLSLGKATPMQGMAAKGKVLLTLVDGEVAYK